MIRLFRDALLIVVAVLVGCSEQAGDEISRGLEAEVRSLPSTENFPAPASVIRDSAGVTIVETGAAVVERALSWGISSVPILEIGLADGDEAYLLSRVKGAGRLGDGRIFVLDGGSRQVRFYGSDGLFMARSGRQGEGPGEFGSEPSLVFALRYDSIMVFDYWLRRFSVVETEAGSMRTLPSLTVTTTPFEVPPGSMVSSGIFTAVGVVGNTHVLTSHPTIVVTRSEGPQPPQRVEYRLTNPETGDSEIVRVFSWQHMFRHAGQAAANPFIGTPMAAVAGDRFYLSSGEGTEVLEFDENGELRRLIQLQVPERVATEADRMRMIEARTPFVRPGVSAKDAEATHRALFGAMPLPEKMPSFQSLRVDEEGLLWVEVFRIDDRDVPEWLIVDGDGQGRGSIRLPKNFQVHQIGEDFILGVGENELGVESIQLYGLTRN